MTWESFYSLLSTLYFLFDFHPQQVCLIYLKTNPLGMTDKCGDVRTLFVCSIVASASPLGGWKCVDKCSRNERQGKYVENYHDFKC